MDESVHMVFGNFAKDKDVGFHMHACDAVDLAASRTAGPDASQSLVELGLVGIGDNSADELHTQHAADVGQLPASKSEYAKVDV